MAEGDGALSLDDLFQKYVANNSQSMAVNAFAKLLSWVFPRTSRKSNKKRTRLYKGKSPLADPRGDWGEGNAPI